MKPVLKQNKELGKGEPVFAVLYPCQRENLNWEFKFNQQWIQFNHQKIFLCHTILSCLGVINTDYFWNNLEAIIHMQVH